MIKAKRQTAGNNDLLRKAKRVWNKPIFAKVTSLVNTEGEAAAVAYLQQFVRERVDVVAHMDEVIAYRDSVKS